MTHDSLDAPSLALVDACTQASLALLEANLTPHGILAASRTEAAVARRYTRIFGRDAAICVMAMCGSGVPALEHGAVASLDALAAQQAANGQIPKYVDPEGQDADFWYLGCIDATLWWLIAVDHVRRHGKVGATHWADGVQRAIGWLLAQEHQHFRLLQQNEASDWADIMPRSGYVLYTNALWFDVKRRFAIAQADETRHHFNHLFNPFQRDLPEYHRARLLQHYARRGRRDPGLYLSFVNLAVVGDEGDVFGNVLAIQAGLADEAMAHSIVNTIEGARASDPYPVRVVLHPLSPQHDLWRAYMGRHRQNLVHQYHNGGIWPFVGGFWAMALAKLGLEAEGWAELAKLARANELDGWRFTEWFHGRTLAPMGMAGQSWNAATFLLARRALEGVATAW
ncbi:glycoside hydrolase [Variovorax paradoxus]|jgi:glycogen debranching enzyme|uniref:glycoside hydrolase 100 family protein n=1 Tax=Variovorax paradoxus TaxID=34073 RepID=UPI0006E4BCF2|nr:glycoside hydrolase [Variovorax paradoxus]KPV03190.1 glycoside hydrolase [Variovorax paradoxus]KPV04417.1 glycoside hydrolase [Variovorax paradoxus]KPV10317.1 glycoside hydrolase [Variovorax paradoxus]KPV31882.1 glycoside hydrolase [Variovorax paradoxus]